VKGQIRKSARRQAGMIEHGIGEVKLSGVSARQDEKLDNSFDHVILINVADNVYLNQFAQEAP
jgi:hypothetical protein